MNVSSGINFNLRGATSPSENAQQRKVEALGPPGIEAPIKSQHRDLKNVASPGREEAGAEKSSAQKEQVQAKDKDKTELSPDERSRVDSLAKRDREVKAHESAHLSAAGDLAKSGPDFEYTKGPDGRRYAAGGEVIIDTSKAETPDATVIKAQRIRAAALAPAQPSAQDQRVSSKASQLVVEARADSRQERVEEERQKIDEKTEETKEVASASAPLDKSDTTTNTEKSVTGKVSAKNSTNVAEAQVQNDDVQPQALAANNRASEYTELAKDSGAGRIFNLVA